MSTPGRLAPLHSDNSLTRSTRKSGPGMNASGSLSLCTPQQCCLRLLRLQHLCAAAGLDAIILILGVDGRNNLGSHQLAGYFMQGCCGHDILDCVKLPEDIEDNFIFVRPDHVYIYSNTPAVTQLCAVFRSCSSNVTVVAPTAMESSDPDELEEVKVAAFVQALTGVHRVGVSLAPELEQCQLLNQDVHVIENWPLLQAYGLEGVGRCGFFSANFEVQNIYPALQPLYAKLDAWSLHDLLSFSLPTLKQHCVEFKRNLMLKLPRSKGEATEKQMAEPLLSYFTYGTLRRTVGVGQVSVMQPRVVSGSRTNDCRNKTADVRLCDPDASTGLVPVHLVMEAADPHSPLRVARTYFLSSGHALMDIFSDEEEVSDGNIPSSQDTESDRYQDTTTLMCLYALLVKATLAAIQHFALEDKATAQSAREVLVQHLLANSAATSQPLTRDAIEQCLVFSLWSCDHANNVCSTAVRGTMQAKVMRAALKDVKSTAPGHPGKLLGSVVYADTFMEVPAGCGEGNTLLNFTRTIPVMITTVCYGSEVTTRLRILKAFSSQLQQLLQARHNPSIDNSLRINRYVSESSSNALSTADSKAADEMRELVTSLGALLSVGGGDEVVVFTGSPAACAHVGVIYFFSYGLVFLPRTCGMLVLDVRHDARALVMQELACPETGLPPLGEALVIRCKAPSGGWTPACHLSDNHHLALPVATFAQGLRRNMLSTVLPAWEQACREAGVPYIRDPTAPHPFASYMYNCQWFEVHKPSKRYEILMPDEKVDATLQRIDDMELLELGWHNPEVERLLLRPSSPQAPTTPDPRSSSQTSNHSNPPCALPADTSMHRIDSVPTLNGLSMTSTASQPGSWVTLVTGLPGSSQLLVASVVASVGTAQGEACKVLALPEQGRPWLEQEELNQKLDALLNAPTSQGGIPHAVLAVSCFDDLPQQLTLLARCPALASGHAQLRSCITCITTHGFFDGDTRQQPLPGGLDQVSSGLVDAVVLNGVNPGSVQQLVQLRAPEVPIVRATWGQLMAARAQLLPPPDERAARLASMKSVLARHWACPHPGRTARLLCGPLQASFAACTGGKLELPKLKALLQELGLDKDAANKQPAKMPLLEAPAPQQPPYLVYAYALVRHPGKGGMQEVVAWRHVGAILRNRESNVDAQLVNTPALVSDDSTPGAELVVYGTALPQGLAERLLREAQPRPAQPPPVLRTPASMTSAEMELVRKLHLWDPLPKGWRCSGSVYVDEFGSSSYTHPCMDTFVDAYLAEQHKKALAQHAQQAAQANGQTTLVFNDTAWWAAA